MKKKIIGAICAIVDPFMPFLPAPPRPHPTRWESDPDVVGNIFEFHAD